MQAPVLMHSPLSLTRQWFAPQCCPVPSSTLAVAPILGVLPFALLEKDAATVDSATPVLADCGNDLDQRTLLWTLQDEASPSAKHPRILHAQASIEALCEAVPPDQDPAHSGSACHC
eukprot:1298415-Amphidinium_carterae.2